jgi:hypothetical protein
LRGGGGSLSFSHIPSIAYLMGTKHSVKQPPKAPVRYSGFRQASSKLLTAQVLVRLPEVFAELAEVYARFAEVYGRLAEVYDRLAEVYDRLAEVYARFAEV